MLKICWANTESFADSDFVIIGVPDESKSHALRKGTAEAPNKIREISIDKRQIQTSQYGIGRISHGRDSKESV